MMLLGMILYRKGILSADKSIGYYKKDDMDRVRARIDTLYHWIGSSVCF